MRSEIDMMFYNIGIVADLIVSDLRNCELPDDTAERLLSLTSMLRDFAFAAADHTDPCNAAGPMCQRSDQAQDPRQEQASPAGRFVVARR